MKAAVRWVLRLLSAFVLLSCLAGAVILAWIIPAYIRLAVESRVGPDYMVRSTQIEPPNRIRIEGIRANSPPSGTGASVQRLWITLTDMDWRNRTIHLDFLFEKPSIRIRRMPSKEFVSPIQALPAVVPVPGRPVRRLGWRIQVDHIEMADGTIELVDEWAAGTFRGLLQHLFMAIGPGPGGEAQPPLSFATRGEIVGVSGHSAPLSCTGWLNWPMADLEGSCRLDPISLHAFGPYLQGTRQIQVRLPDALISGTARWEAQANNLDGRFQVRLDRLTDGDISVRNRPVIDFGELTRANNGKLISEIRVVGQMKQPTGWHWEWVPGTDLVQQRIRSRFDSNTEAITLPLLGQKVDLVLIPIGDDFVQTLWRASEEINQALEIVSTPLQ